MRNLGEAATASDETFQRLFMDVQGGLDRLLDCSYGLWVEKVGEAFVASYPNLPSLERRCL